MPSKAPALVKACGTCDVEFTVSPRVGARQKFCSKRCARKSAPSNNRGRRNPWTERACANCDVVFTRSGSRGGARRYCTDVCKAEAARKRFYTQRWKHVARRYGITEAMFEAMWSAQDGRCAICSTALTGRGLEATAPQVDHNHLTDQLRAILCRPCNTALGMFRDDPALVDRAAQYLREWAAAALRAV